MGESVNYRKETNAYLTVYLTLTLTIVLSLYLALIESARQNAFFLETECVTDVGLNSALAEYHRELLDQYNLFAVDSSYGTVLPQVDITGRHLSEYIEMNLSTDEVFMDWLLYRDFVGASLKDVEVTKARYLTDGDGAVFRRRAAEAVWNDMNLNLFEDLQGWMQTVESEKLAERDIEAEKHKLDQELDSYDGEEVYISETEWITIDVVNPTDALEKLRKKGILSLAVDNPLALSNKSISTENLIESRAAVGSINDGNMELAELAEGEKLLERFFFQEYLLQYMGHYGAESEEDVLSYQIEYLIAGQGNDINNLQSVANTIFAVRQVANTLYVFSDEDSRIVAGVLAKALAIAMELPEAKELLEWILLFGWAFAESVYDMRCLMNGERIPLMKDPESWFFSLDKALTMNLIEVNRQETEGLSYEDYLRILMCLQDEEQLTMRAMNMVEADIRATEGNEHFRLDGCLDSVEVVVQFESAFGYECEITRQKGYSTQ